MAIDLPHGPTPVMAPAEEGAPALTLPKGSLAALVIVGATIFNAAAMRLVFSPVQEVVKAALHVSDFQMSMVQGVAASVPVAILALPIGRMIDRGNRVRLMIGLAVLWTLGTFLTAFANDFNTLFVARMLAGLGAVVSVPVGISLAADFCLPQVRGRSLLILGIGNMAGAAVAFAAGGILYGLLSAKGAAPLFGLSAWRSVHMIFGVVSAALTLLLFAVREPPRMEVAAPSASLRVAMKELSERWAFLLPLFIGQIGVVMADTAAGIWAAPVLTRSFHLQPGQFAGWMGAVILGSGIIGSVLGGISADFGQKIRFKGGILMGAVLAASFAIPSAFFPIMPDVGGFAWMLTILLLCGAMAGLITSTAIAVLVPNEIRGVCLGAFVVIGAIVGFGLAPVLVSLGSDLLGGESHLDMALAVTGCGVGVVSFIAFLVAMLNAPRKVAA